MTSDHGRYWDFTLSFETAETLTAALEQRLQHEPRTSSSRLVAAHEALSDAFWLGRWLGEKPRLSLAESDIACVLEAVAADSSRPSLVAVRTQLEEALRSAPRSHEAVAV